VHKPIGFDFQFLCEIRAKTIEALNACIRAEALSWRVLDISMREIDDGTSATPVKWAIISVATDSFAMLKGAYEGLPVPPHVGIVQTFVEGYLLGFFRSRYPNHGVQFVALDIISTRPGHIMPVESECITIQQAIERGWLERSTPLHDALEYYSLSHVHVLGQDLIGPRLGYIEITRAVTKMLRPSHCVDLFAGTLGATIVALREGAGIVECYDRVFCSAARRQAANLNGCLVLHEGDVHNLSLPKSHLLLADPFFHELPAFLSGFSSTLLTTARAVVLSIGNEYEWGWLCEIRPLLTLIFPSYAITRYRGEFFCVAPLSIAEASGLEILIGTGY
jgi:hypothetical protein